MIATTIVDEIRRMLREEGLSQRKIASRTGVSRGTVNAIAQGKRLCPVRRPVEGEDESGFIVPQGLPVRCPGCGGLVQMPCLLCHLRNLRSSRTPARAIPC